MSVNVVNNDGSLSRVAGGTLYADAPIGVIIPYGGSEYSVPSGWLWCNGQEVDRTEYSDLFAVIGTKFGEGHDSNTFNVPDLREATTKGAGLSRFSSNHYSSSGIKVGDFVDDQFKRHGHEIYVRDTGHIHGILFEFGQFVPGAYGFQSPYVSQNANASVISSNANIQVNSSPAFNGEANATTREGETTNEVKAVGVNYIIKAKQVSVPTDFSSSMVGYLGQESNYNLYPWSHVKSEAGDDISQDITIERDGWYSIDYTLTNGSDVQNTFTLRDFDSQGGVHIIMRSVYDRSGTFRQTYLVPLKAGIYRYSHGGVGSLSVYMNRRDFA